MESDWVRIFWNGGNLIDSAMLVSATLSGWQTGG
jgi:hypothetical protein